MAQIKKELGSDVIIVKTRQIEQDDHMNLLLGNRSSIEVTVAIEDNPQIDNTSQVTTQEKQMLGYTNRGQVFYSKPDTPSDIIDFKPDTRLQKRGLNNRVESKDNDFSHLKEQMETFFKQMEDKFEKTIVAKGSSMEELLPHIEDLQEELKEIKKQLNTNKPVSSEPLLPEIGKLLIEQEVEEEIVASICRNIDEAMLNESPQESSVLLDYMQRLISRITRYSDGLEVEEGVQKRLAIIGPTGVGKTTTIAKLAADIALIAQKKLAVFSIDTFRIGAQEQLATYTDIIQVPFELIHDADELNEKMALHSDKDVILIDTVGRGGYHSTQIEAMRDLFRACEYPIETHLAINSVTKWSDLRDIVDTFGVCDISCLLFTKLDETRRFGTIFNLAVRTQIPVSYMTDGQNVPEDIAIMNSELMTKLLLKRLDPSRKADAETIVNV